MIALDEFRAMLLAGEHDSLIDDYVLAPGAECVVEEDIEYIRRKLADTYRIGTEDVDVVITGSAKFGFSLVEKRDQGEVLARYRAFSARSDIDVAVVSQKLFDCVWRELSKRAHRVHRLPWDSKRLGDYMVYGWLRPDYFPTDVRIRACDDWWDQFRRFSADPRFGRHKVRGGLFYSREQLRMYVQRSIADCVYAEELVR